MQRLHELWQWLLEHWHIFFDWMIQQPPALQVLVGVVILAGLALMLLGAIHTLLEVLDVFVHGVGKHRKDD